jgi:hypothetical protein
VSLLGNGSVNCIPYLVARQRVGKHVPAAMNTGSIRGIVGQDISSDVRALLKASMWLRMQSPVIASYGLIKTFPWQRIFVTGVDFCVVRVVPNESRQLFPKHFLINDTSAMS